MSGIVSTGFELKTLSDLLEEMSASEKANIAPDFLTSSDSVGGQLNGIVADRAHELWLVAQAVYAGLSRATAEDTQLDALGRLLGLQRLQATSSSVVLRFTGTSGTPVDGGFRVGDPNDSSKVFATDDGNAIGGDGTMEVLAVATTPGRIEANANTLISLLSSTSGVTAVTNPSDASPGRNKETDAEFRIRQEQSFLVRGRNTGGSIRAGLLAIPGVSFCSVYKNTSMSTVDGMPPKSIEVITEGGSDATIRQVIFERAPFGIETHGNTSGTVSDENGIYHTIKFSRPTAVPVKIQGTIYKNASVFPGLDTWKQTLIDYVDSLQPGQPVRYTKLIDVGYNVPGVIDLVISGIGPVTGFVPGVTTNIAISTRAMASLSASDITMTLVDAT